MNPHQEKTPPQKASDTRTPADPKKEENPADVSHSAPTPRAPSQGLLVVYAMTPRRGDDEKIITVTDEYFWQIAIDAIYRVRSPNELEKVPDFLKN